LNASSIVAFYKSLDFHQNHKNRKWNDILTEMYYVQLFQ
jgi:hypothetical protein